MKLSVVQRTIAGFTLMFILIALLSSVSLFNAKTLQNKVEQITEQTTPMVITSGNLITQLMHTNLLVSSFQTNPEINSNVNSIFEQQRLDFFNTLNSAQQDASLEQERITLQTINNASIRYFDQASKLIALQHRAEELRQQRQQLDLSFLQMEDSYQRAASLFLQKASTGRSLRNRAELITSGIRRDLKLVRRINEDTPIGLLRLALTKDSEITLKRINFIPIAEDVKARYTRNLKNFKALILDPDGLLDVVEKQNDVTEQLLFEREVNLELTDDIQSLLEEQEHYAQQLAHKSSEEAKQSINDAMVYIIVMTSIAAISSIIVGFSITRSIQKPLILIKNVLEKMTDGDMRTRANYAAKDEFGELSRSIDTLAATMSHTLGQFDDGASHLLNETNNSTAVTEIAMQRVEDQKLRTDQVAAAISQMEVSAKEISRSTELTVTEVENTNEAAANGRSQVSLNRSLTEQLSDNIGEAVSNTQQLNKYSNNIGSILHVIQDIAEQTNLLALNAAIEAARAGSHGRGFAVVADEVRALATRTQSSTEEIQSMINNLQGNASRMAETMNASQKQMKECLTQTRLTDDTLQDIALRMQSIQEMTVHIAQATEEQIKVSIDVAEHINGIAHVAHQAHNDARASKLSSESLANMAQEQQNLISNFRV
ncbi:methyl-accepting chemotaxis protein [Enterovibrio baiacu]|uniref:methyl-accepting chemotaxis protein n=1 Tax=Enterovibrio baiacu TaxID=2491023 RepID=UPI003D0E66F7